MTVNVASVPLRTESVTMPEARAYRAGETIRFTVVLSQPVTVAGGRYVDRFEVRGGAWKVAHRRIVFGDIVSEAMSTAAGFPPGFTEQRHGNATLPFQLLGLALKLLGVQRMVLRAFDVAVGMATVAVPVRSREELLAIYREQRAAVLRLLETLSESDLDRPTGIEYAPTVGALVSMQGGHWIMHAGQWAVIRRQLGRKPLF